MINFKKENIRFNYRVAGVSIHKNRVLLHRLEKDNFWALPGGRCELLENSRETILREYLEETGFKVIVGRPLWFLENFFSHNGEQFHEISMIYKIDFLEDNVCLDEDVFYGVEESTKIIFKWFRLDEILKLELYPTFLRSALKALPQNLEHIIHRDN